MMVFSKDKKGIKPRENPWTEGTQEHWLWERKNR